MTFACILSCFGSSLAACPNSRFLQKHVCADCDIWTTPDALAFSFARNQNRRLGNPTGANTVFVGQNEADFEFEMTDDG